MVFTMPGVDPAFYNINLLGKMRSLVQYWHDSDGDHQPLYFMLGSEDLSTIGNLSLYYELGQNSMAQEALDSKGTLLLLSS